MKNVLICGAGEKSFRNYDSIKHGKKFTYLDKHKFKSVNVIHNLEVTPLPFDNDVFDEIFCSHVIEHISNLIGLMKEFHRIIKSDGVITIIVPYWLNLQNQQDPTHVRNMNYYALDFLTKDRKFSEGNYLMNNISFKIYDIKYTFNKWLRLVEKFANRYPFIYEASIIKFIFPAGSITFKLIKNDSKKQITS